MGVAVAHVNKARRSVTIARAQPALAAWIARIVKLAGRAMHVARVTDAPALAARIVHAPGFAGADVLRAPPVVAVAGARSGEALGDARLQLSVAM